jgi:tRNA threonylcarbamoyladenosine biosynthesis protein TsaB
LSFLFVDSTYDITLGILDDNFRWIDFRKFTNQKASAILQTETYKMFEDHKLKVKDIKALFNVSGPGFYTGLRLSEGLCDVFKFFDIPHYSFYSYELPLICGYNEGAWFTKAYKGEYFLHCWRDRDVKSELFATKDVEIKLNELTLPLFIHSASALDTHSTGLVKNFISTSDLLKESSEKIFKHILEHKPQRESFYFRAPEDEFRVST